MTPKAEPEDKIAQALELMERYQRVTGSGNAQTFNVNMGGHGITWAWSAAVISLVLFISFLLTMNGKIVDLKDDFSRDTARIQADVIAKAQEARDERTALKQSQETQQAYLNVLLQNSKSKEPAK
jgi:hypothetical protein